MNKIGLIGTGIFGTALALTASRAGNKVLCQARDSELVEDINRKHVNQKYLPDVPLPDSISATSEFADVFDFSDTILLTVSAQAVRSVLHTVKSLVKKDTVIILCAKGIELETGKMMSEIAAEEIPDTTVAILSGPGFAVDIARCRLTSVTIACDKPGIASRLTNNLATPYFRPYTTSDMISPQIGGSVKNVIAIASGVIEGAQFGNGARAALITRGLHEMGRLSDALGGLHNTMMGMSGLGDLVLTASCSQSRNFSFGYEIGICGHAQKVLDENTRTVEGICTAQAVVKRARALGIEMPICEMVNRVLFSGTSIKTAMEELMARPFKEEGF
ncbi:MAG: NAD(P)H-dependent glycerol-3-phosphate dehydrogenase [Pseudomonadota bacterium]|nr:NAD(P)H-dependent glycerol-3-phosphate dehydrogenase [Pseudomonadota bacterium]